MAELESKGGYTIDPMSLDVAIGKIADGEKIVQQLVDDIRTHVITAACDCWDDPYSQKLIDAIDKVNNSLDNALQSIKNNEVMLKQAANALLAGSTSTRRYPETPSVE